MATISAEQGERPGLDQPLSELASSAPSRAHHKLLKQGNGFETLSKSDRHDVRIALKRLRYALDFFGSIFDGELKKKFSKRLARLQDDLGRMNDVAVAESMLAGLVGVANNGSEPAGPGVSHGQLAFAAGAILGWHRRRAAEIDLQLVKDWNSFVRAQPFWQRETPPISSHESTNRKRAFNSSGASRTAVAARSIPPAL
jgi:hypothetical protein